MAAAVVVVKKTRSRLLLPGPLVSRHLLRGLLLSLLLLLHPGPDRLLPTTQCYLRLQCSQPGVTGTSQCGTV
jgi:hypothetical protein